jgi:crotonobetainyl-CoA:carnitine CoA-transferase CaiB-like acyl-CoA transferase
MLPTHRLPPSPGASFSLLHGIRVLDLTTSIAGPYATQLLADLGAEVLKVERPGAGDDCRAWGPPFLDGESLWFLSVNRNKRSLTLDYVAAAGRRVLDALVRRADVVVVNLMPAVQEKLGVSSAALRSQRPDLIHVSVTGFGCTGARRDFPCYDLVAEGHSGVMDLTGEPSGAPQKVGTPAADLLAGADAALATLAAIFDRQRTGRGHAIDISMVESMTRFMAPRLVPYLGSGELPRRSGARDSVIAVYQVFDAADLPLTLGLGNDGIWKRFWAAVGLPERGEDPRRRTNVDRRAARAEIVAEIQGILATRPRAEWLRIFAEARVPAGPINRLDEVAADPMLAERQLLFSLPGREHPIPQVGLGIRIDDRASGANLPPPRLGEHTDEALREWAGCDEQQIAALRAERII